MKTSIMLVRICTETEVVMAAVNKYGVSEQQLFHAVGLAARGEVDDWANCCKVWTALVHLGVINQETCVFVCPEELVEADVLGLALSLYYYYFDPDPKESPFFKGCRRMGPILYRFQQSGLMTADFWSKWPLPDVNPAFDDAFEDYGWSWNGGQDGNL